jgi:hypothetical protein
MFKPKMKINFILKNKIDNESTTSVTEINFRVVASLKIFH